MNVRRRGNPGPEQKQDDAHLAFCLQARSELNLNLQSSASVNFILFFNLPFANETRPIRPAQFSGGQLTSAATHVLMSTAAWQLPANPGAQVLPVGTLLSDFCLT